MWAISTNIFNKSLYKPKEGKYPKGEKEKLKRN